MVTTGPYAERLGLEVAASLGVPNATAVSSCTTGLVLAIQALQLPEGAEVILPSFTFMASGIAPVWNRLRLRFVDVDGETMNIDPARVEEAITPDTALILGVHQFGSPAPIEALQHIADRHGLFLAFDAAHGFGAYHQGEPLGKNGRFEVFSLSPTKLLIAAEGGIVSTNDPAIAEHVRIGRNYGNPGNYDCLFPGLNARMSELHAILALYSLTQLEAASRHRNQAVGWYKERLAEVPGIGFQRIQEGDISSYKDFSIVVEASFGMSRDRLMEALKAEQIHTRVYYSPVLHRMQAFLGFGGEALDEQLPHTLHLQEHALSLPLYSDMKEDEVDLVCAAIHRIHKAVGRES
jgi:dTDP-4-amino-4,6-dideoxygalactose transaminase